jgi:hypothetical protein
VKALRVILCNCIYTQAALAFLADSFVAGLGNQRVNKIMLNDFRVKQEDG